MDMAAFNKEIKDWEWHWVNERKEYKLTTTGDPIVMAKAMYEKYRSVIQKAANW
jgi:alpha-N-acetylglucosaminidase